MRGDENWPLIVQSRFGNGNVLMFTSTVSPVWNNWARNATFPPLMLLAEDLLADGRFPQADLLVGFPLHFDFPTSEFSANADLVMPSPSSSKDPIENRLMVSRTMVPENEKYPIVLGGESQPDETVLPGVYDIWLRRRGGHHEIQRFALNVDTRESETALAIHQQLLSQLDSANPKMLNWDQFDPAPQQESTTSLSKLLLVLLILVLIAEQILAYQCSYHPRLRRDDTPTRHPSDTFPNS